MLLARRIVASVAQSSWQQWPHLCKNRIADPEHCVDWSARRPLRRPAIPWESLPDGDEGSDADFPASVVSANVKVLLNCGSLNSVSRGVEAWLRDVHEVEARFSIKAAVVLDLA